MIEQMLRLSLIYFSLPEGLGQVAVNPGAPVTPTPLTAAPITTPAPNAMCSSLVCSAGFKPKPNAATLPCLNGVCDAASFHTCCDAAATMPMPRCGGWENEWRECGSAPVCNPVKCQWSSWSEWVPKGGNTGLLERKRYVAVEVRPLPVGACDVPCNGVKVETKLDTVAPPQHFDVNCTWGAWTAWDTTPCRFSSPYYGHHLFGNVTRSTNQQFRSRLITRLAEGNGLPCQGPSNLTQPCSSPEPPVDCKFGDWSQYTACSATCGSGHQQRTRVVLVNAKHGGAACSGPIAVQINCPVPSVNCTSPNPCKFNAWLDWQGCDSASPHQRHRSRTLVPGNPRCTGQLQELGGCNSTESKCKISDWTSWHGCSVSCGGGQHFRCRHVLRGGSSHQGDHCPSEPLVQTQPCAQADCPNPIGVVSCKMSDWKEWSYCSNDCGSGTKFRNRTILGPMSDKYGCKGNLREIKPCMGNRGSCEQKVNCRWEDWSAWGGCTRTCGGGTKRRYRGVAETHRNGGVACDPRDEGELAPCNEQSCNAACIDGSWTDWGHWTTCRGERCEVGFRSRHRMEASQPNDCGKTVQGVTDEFEKCYGPGLNPDGTPVPGAACSRDCELANWSPWSGCSQTCRGYKHRSRGVAKYALGAGKPCNGTLQESVQCNPGPGEACPVGCCTGHVKDCEMWDWSAWSACTHTCDGGHKTRERHVKHSAHGFGKKCEGSLSEKMDCSTAPCPISACKDCLWNQWGDWSACSKAGDSRMRRRNIEQMPNHCGKTCDTKAATELSECRSSGKPDAFCTWTDWGNWAEACSTACGPDRQTRTRTLHVTTVLQATYLVRDRTHGTVHYCLGMQTDQKACPPHPCNITCTPVPCQFNDWTEWGEGNCQGLCNRFRSVKAHAQCGAAPCNGNLLETKQCVAVCDQPQDCKLGDWEMWGSCNVVGKTHSQTYRARPILMMPHHGGSPNACLKNISQTKWCQGECQKADCKLTDWSMWTQCTRSCGTGWQLRKRHILEPAMCGGLPCNGTVRDMMPCNTMACPSTQVDCSWHDWEQWSACGLNKQRSRQRGMQSMQAGGKACINSSAEIEPCPDEGCRISDWIAWTHCDKTCDGGQQYRHRQIHNLGSGFGGCKMPLDTWETQGCNEAGCHPKTDCEVTPWADWSACSATCGHGQELRSRAILHPRNHHGEGCQDSLNEVRGCVDPPPCDSSHCHYAPWSAWGTCSLKCGGGEKIRSRGFLQEGLVGGAPCHAPENMQEVEACNTQPCTDCKHVEWSNWSPWANCHVTCGGAMTFRYRSVDTSPGTCGIQGPDKEWKICGEAPCPHVDCKFSNWAGWGPCMAACDGVMKTSRTIQVHSQGHGAACNGPMEVYAPCKPMEGEERPAECHHTPKVPKVDCTWSEWSATPCSRTCDGGTQILSRNVLAEAQNGGQVCHGVGKKIQTCNTHVCPIGDEHDCKYGVWHDWEPCVPACGGHRKRYRDLTMPHYDGKQCQLNATEQVESCNRRCTNGHFCVWATWGAWSACNVTQGWGSGRQNRSRVLLLSTSQPDPPMPDMNFYQAQSGVSAKFEALKEDMKLRSQSHSQDLVLCFLGGCICFFLVAVVVRFFSARRTSVAYSVLADEAE